MARRPPGLVGSRLRGASCGPVGALTPRIPERRQPHSDLIPRNIRQLQGRRANFWLDCRLGSGRMVLRWSSVRVVVACALALLTMPMAQPAVASTKPTVGVYNPNAGQWHLRNSAGAVTSFYFGNPGDIPMIGDWDCNGTETIGIYRQSNGQIYLRNWNSQGGADLSFFFGNPGDVPIVGDFDGDGCDTVSVYRPSTSTIYIVNRLPGNGGSLGAADFSYAFGNSGDKPIVGDFDGDGYDTIAMFRPSNGVIYFRNSHGAGGAEYQFYYGSSGDQMLAGAWADQGHETPTAYKPSNAVFYFRYSNTQGTANAQLAFGNPNWIGVSGLFGLG